MGNALQIGISHRRILAGALAAAVAFAMAGPGLVHGNDTAAKEQLHVGFRDIAPTNDKEAKKLLGARVSGSVVVTYIATDPSNPNVVFVKAVEDAPKIAGAYMRVQQNHWLRISVTFTVDEQTSWALNRGESVSLSADVATVKFSANQNFATGGRGNDNLVLLGLSNVKLGIVE